MFVSHWYMKSRLSSTLSPLLISAHLQGTLFTLAAVVSFKELHRTSPFAHMLPPGREFFKHPIAFVETYIEVFRLNTAHTSAVTAERRKKKVEDVRKRSEYRKAHGLDKNEGFGGWTARSDKELLGPALRTEKEKSSLEPESGSKAIPAAEGDDEGNADQVESPGVYRDWRGKRRPVKKWLGIW